MGFIRRLIRRFRDAITGRFVSRSYAERNPSTTVGERINQADKKG